MPEEPCQCPDCQRFYREHDRLIRENPTLRQQQELNWAALQSFRTLAGRALEELQKIHGDGESAPPSAASMAPAVPPGSGHGEGAEEDAIQQATLWMPRGAQITSTNCTEMIIDSSVRYFCSVQWGPAAQ